MRRLFATTTLALAFVAAPACDKKEEEKKDAAKTAKADAGKKDAGKKGDAKAKAGADAKGDAKGDAAPAAAGGSLVEMVPEGAKVLAVIDLKGLVGSAAYKQQSAMLEQGDVGKRLAAAKACNLGTETWNQLVLGMDPDGDDAVAMGMGATGIGKKENIECIAAKYKEADPKADWKIEDKDGKTVITVDGGDGVIYAVNDDAVVMASKAWQSAVADRVAGKGAAASTGSLKDAMALAGSGKHITFAGLATKDMAAGPTAGLKHFGGSLDLSDGLALSAALAFADAGAATGKAAEFNKMFEGFKGMAGGMGVPQPVVDSVKIEAKDATVAVSMKATAKELETVGQAAMKSMMAGPPR